jgi:hypothetical protein
VRYGDLLRGLRILVLSASLSIDDHRAPLATTEVWGAVLNSNPLVVIISYSVAMAECKNSEVLRKCDDLDLTTCVPTDDGRRVTYARVSLVTGKCIFGERLDPLDNRGPLEHNHFIGHYERLDVSELLGECPPLCARITRCVRIKDVMIAAKELSASALVPGQLIMRAPAVISLDESRPIQIADVIFGGPGTPIAVGSRVYIDGNTARNCVVTVSDTSTMAPRFKLHDLKCGGSALAEWFGENRLTHIAFTIPVLSPNGTASPISETGLPPLYGAKQLWLYAPGIVARPSSIECFRLLELSDSVRENLIQANNGAVDEIYLEAAAGAGLSMR